MELIESSIKSSHELREIVVTTFPKLQRAHMIGKSGYVQQFCLSLERLWTMFNALDLALFGGFIALWIGIICFRRFHQFENFVKPEDIGPTAWGLYGAPKEKAVPATTSHKKEKRS